MDEDRWDAEYYLYVGMKEMRGGHESESPKKYLRLPRMQDDKRKEAR
jgi:hypothetical protein